MSMKLEGPEFRSNRGVAPTTDAATDQRSSSGRVEPPKSSLFEEPPLSSAHTTQSALLLLRKLKTRNTENRAAPNFDCAKGTEEDNQSTSSSPTKLQRIEGFEKRNLTGANAKRRKPKKSGANLNAGMSLASSGNHADRSHKTTSTQFKASRPRNVEMSGGFTAKTLARKEDLSAKVLSTRNRIIERRRQGMKRFVARAAAFVFVPTLGVFIYLACIATPAYTTKSQFVVQQADAGSSYGNLPNGVAVPINQDSIMVQTFLTSREALRILEQDVGYREHYNSSGYDYFQKLLPEASNEKVYAHFKRNVRVAYDHSEAVLRMEVTAPSPHTSQVFSEALIRYAEQRLDQITERKRTDQMKEARKSFEEAEAKLLAAQSQVLQIQNRLGVIDPAVETAALMNRISTFEMQLEQKNLHLHQLLDNERPNQARVSGVRGDIERIQRLVTDLRGQLTTDVAGDGSLAATSAKLKMAEAELNTRTMLMQAALESLENARVEALRQVRFLSMSAAPIAPDMPTYPRIFWGTFVAFFVCCSMYLLAALTVSIVREQIVS